MGCSLRSGRFIESKWPIHGVQPKKWSIHAEQVADSCGATYESRVEKGKKGLFKMKIEHIFSNYGATN